MKLLCTPAWGWPWAQPPVMFEWGRNCQQTKCDPISWAILAWSSWPVSIDGWATFVYVCWCLIYCYGYLKIFSFRCWLKEYIKMHMNLIKWQRHKSSVRCIQYIPVHVLNLSFLFPLLKKRRMTTTWTTPTVIKIPHTSSDHQRTRALLLSAVCLWRDSRALKKDCSTITLLRFLLIESSESFVREEAEWNVWTTSLLLLTTTLKSLSVVWVCVCVWFRYNIVCPETGINVTDIPSFPPLIDIKHDIASPSISPSYLYVLHFHLQDDSLLGQLVWDYDLLHLSLIILNDHIQEHPLCCDVAGIGGCKLWYLWVGNVNMMCTLGEGNPFPNSSH